MIQQRDILLVPFPFSDQSGKKVRPVLVLSGNRYNAIGEDIIVCGITSVLKKAPFTTSIAQADLDEGMLFAQSAVKIDNMFKVSKRLVMKKIGRIKKEKFAQVQKAFSDIFT